LDRVRRNTVTDNNKELLAVWYGMYNSKYINPHIALGGKILQNGFVSLKKSG